jgi:hypothetical protein
MISAYVVRSEAKEARAQKVLLIDVFSLPEAIKSVPPPQRTPVLR